MSQFAPFLGVPNHTLLPKSPATKPVVRGRTHGRGVVGVTAGEGVLTAIPGTLAPPPTPRYACPPWRAGPSSLHPWSVRTRGSTRCTSRLRRARPFSTMNWIWISKLKWITSTGCFEIPQMHTPGRRPEKKRKRERGKERQKTGNTKRKKRRKTPTANILD